MSAPRTFPDLLATQLRPAADPGRPLVTWYGDQGERVELSVTSYANWVAKTASLLQDELDVARGDTVLLDLPTHWLTPVWLGACWTVGAVVATPDSPVGDDPALVVCGPAGLDRHAPGGAPVVACSLDALGRRFTEPLPAGVVDFGEVVWGQPDAFVAIDPPSGDDPAWAGAGRALDQAGVAALRLPGPDDATRLATALPPLAQDGPARLVHALASGGGTVWVGDASDLARIADVERARADAPAGGQPAKS